MKAFKVLRRDRQKKLWSYIVRGKAKVQYFVGKKSRPPEKLRKRGYGLLVFNTSEAAIKFAGRENKKTIRECEVGKPRLTIPPRCLIFKLQEQGSLCPSGQCLWPEGTMMVPWVQILRANITD
jgi:hypothetical protein